MGSASRPAAAATNLFDIFVIVITGSAYHASRCDIAMATWVSQFPAGHVLFVTDVASAEELARLPLLAVSPDGLPMNYTSSQQKWVRGWQHVFAGDALDGRHRWFFTVDDDAYVNAENLLRLVRSYDHTQPMVISQLAECSWDGVERVPFTRPMGGAGWLMSVAGARLLRPLLQPCMAHQSARFGTMDTLQSDVMVPACFHEHLGEQLAWVDAPEMNQFQPYLEQQQWFLQHWVHPQPEGWGAAVTFHEMKPWPRQLAMYRLEHAFQRTQRALDTLHSQVRWLMATASLTLTSGAAEAEEA